MMMILTILTFMVMVFFRPVILSKMSTICLIMKMMMLMMVMMIVWMMMTMWMWFMMSSILTNYVIIQLLPNVWLLFINHLAEREYLVTSITTVTVVCMRSMYDGLELEVVHESRANRFMNLTSGKRRLNFCLLMLMIHRRTCISRSRRLLTWPFTCLFVWPVSWLDHCSLSVCLLDHVLYFAFDQRTCPEGANKH